MTHEKTNTSAARDNKKVRSYEPRTFKVNLDLFKIESKPKPIKPISISSLNRLYNHHSNYTILDILLFEG